MRAYRCTRADLYKHDCLGRYNVGARQGHYVVAESETEARAVMRAAFPGETIDIEDKGPSHPLALVTQAGDL